MNKIGHYHIFFISFSPIVCKVSMCCVYLFIFKFLLWFCPCNFQMARGFTLTFSISWWTLRMGAHNWKNDDRLIYKWMWKSVCTTMNKLWFYFCSLNIQSEGAPSRWETITNTSPLYICEPEKAISSTWTKPADLPSWDSLQEFQGPNRISGHLGVDQLISNFFMSTS